MNTAVKPVCKAIADALDAGDIQRPGNGGGRRKSERQKEAMADAHAAMNLVYIAGPYRGDVVGNTSRALAVARDVFVLGGFAIVSHVLSTSNGDVRDAAFWLAGTVEVMRRCDAVVVCPGWEQSQGTRAEIDEAVRLGIPVFFWPDVKAFSEWLSTQTPEIS